MKKQLFLLPLVALLASCNNSGGGSSANWDKFANIRNTKISEETKAEVLSNYHGFTLKNTMTGRMTITGEETSSIDDFNQVYTLDFTMSDNKESGRLEYLVDMMSAPLMTITYDKNSDPQYQGSIYGDSDVDLEGIYKYCEGQLFSWKASYYSGLCSAFTTDPTGELLKTNFYKIFCGVVVIEGDVKEGSFSIGISERITVSEFDEYETTTYLKSFSMAYRDYRLVSYQSEMEVYMKYESSRQTVNTKTVAEITYK